MVTSENCESDLWTVTERERFAVIQLQGGIEKAGC